MLQNCKHWGTIMVTKISTGVSLSTVTSILKWQAHNIFKYLYFNCLELLLLIDMYAVWIFLFCFVGECGFCFCFFVVVFLGEVDNIYTFKKITSVCMCVSLSLFVVLVVYLNYVKHHFRYFSLCLINVMF